MYSLVWMAELIFATFLSLSFSSPVNNAFMAAFSFFSLFPSNPPGNAILLLLLLLAFSPTHRQIVSLGRRSSIPNGMTIIHPWGGEKYASWSSSEKLFTLSSIILPNQARTKTQKNPRSREGKQWERIPHISSFSLPFFLFPLQYLSSPQKLSEQWWNGFPGWKNSYFYFTPQESQNPSSPLNESCQ